MIALASTPITPITPIAQASKDKSSWTILDQQTAQACNDTHAQTFKLTATNFRAIDNYPLYVLLLCHRVFDFITDSIHISLIMFILILTT